MTDQSKAPMGPGNLTDYLTELLARLRRFHGPVDTATGIPAATPRLKVGGRLLPEIRLASVHGRESLVRLSGVLDEITTFLEDHPESVPGNLHPSLDRLAGHLEKLLVLADAGADQETLLGHHGWRAVLASFRFAGSPLGVLDDLEDVLRNWDEVWRGQDLPAAQERMLWRRWERFKRLGDGMFRSADQDLLPGTPIVDDPPLILLVDSGLQRAQIQGKLSVAGWKVMVAPDPAAAAELLALATGRVVVLCDNIEPTNHLVVLESTLSRENVVIRPTVILVPSSADDPLDRRVGADYQPVWAEPFDPAELRRILQRLSQP